MEYSAGTSWLQQQPVSDVHDARTTTNDGWKEAATAVAAGAGPSDTQPGMDLSDFGLDLSVSSSNGPIPSPNNSYYTFPSHGNFFLSGAPSTYGAVPYGGTQWTGPSTSQLPLSSYSSLNGATSVSPATAQRPSSSSASPPQMMIDPTLATINGSNSHALAQFTVPFLSSQAPQHSSYPYQHSSHSSALSINPSFVHTTPSHFQQQQPQAQRHPQQASPPQVTLAPYVLHSPPNSAMHSTTPVPASSFYAQPHASTSSSSSTPTPQPLPPPPPPPSSGLTSEQSKEKFMAGLKPLLKSDSFSGARAVILLAGCITSYGVSKVDVATRLEILSKIRDNAPNHYFRAWAESNTAMSITKKWLIESGSAEADTPESTATMPLLHIVDRLPMTVETLKDSGIGKEIKRLSKSSPSFAVRDMSSNIANKWRSLIASSNASQAPGLARTNTEDTDAKTKKRRADEPPSGAKAAPAKKSTPPSSVKTTTTTKKPPSKAGVKDAKSDSSFFSTPKPKPKLPDFKKAPVTVKKEPDPNVAQPSSYNPFEEIVKSLKPRKDSPASATPPLTGPAGTSQVSDVKKSGKKKTVTWAPDSQLEMVKLIERAVYDDDPADGMHGTHSLRDLDRSEGAALIAHLFEEQIDYYDPPPLNLPPIENFPEKGLGSFERVTQEKREEGALVAVYMSEAHIPDSPAEPSSQIPEDQVDKEVKMMLTGPEVDADFWSEGGPAMIEDTAPPTASVAELVGQLTASAPDVTMAGSGTFGSYDPLANIGPEQLQQLLQQAQAFQNSSMYPPAAQPAVQPPHTNVESNWNNYPGGGGYEEETRWGEDNWRGGGGGARGGRGRGRGRGGGFGRGDGYRSNNNRRPCTFFMQGRCKYGDQCDFSHELGLNY